MKKKWCQNCCREGKQWSQINLKWVNSFIITILVGKYFDTPPHYFQWEISMGKDLAQPLLTLGLGKAAANPANKAATWFPHCPWFHSKREMMIKPTLFSSVKKSAMSLIVWPFIMKGSKSHPRECMQIEDKEAGQLNRSLFPQITGRVASCRLGCHCKTKGSYSLALVSCSCLGRPTRGCWC